MTSRSPIDGAALGEWTPASRADVDAAIGRAHQAWLHWRNVPAPVRGELVRRIGDRVRARKSELARWRRC